MNVPKDIFPYEYMGGGHFRQTGVPVGQKAEMLHGMQAIEFMYVKMVSLGVVLSQEEREKMAIALGDEIKKDEKNEKQV